MDDIVLTADQQNAVNSMLNFVNSSESYFTLAGYAGTGKTVALQHFAQACDHSLVFTAPTNKATKVMRSMARSYGLNTSCRTIHSLLGLGLQEDREHLEAEQLGPSNADAFHVVVVDEASMVDENLFGIIGKAVSEYGIKVIFVGDPMQLPPINEHHSQVFDVKANVQLTEIVRQAENSSIIELTEKIRLAISGSPLPDLTTYNCNSVQSVDYFTWDAWFRDAFGSQNGDPDQVRALAWRNRTVIRYNDIARKELYGNDVEPFVVGERVLAASPIRTMKNGYPYTIMTVDDEATIDKITPVKFDKHPQIKVLRLTMSGDDGRTIYAKVCHPECTPLLEVELKKLKDAACTKKGQWRDYYRFKRAFDDIRPCHALTVHRSQGSTYKITFVDTTDILCNPRRHEALRCLYVACSRASDFVVLG